MAAGQAWQNVALIVAPAWCVQALDNLMPGFDKEIAKLAQRVLINPRAIDYHTGVLATKVTPGVLIARRSS